MGEKSKIISLQDIKKKQKKKVNDKSWTQFHLVLLSLQWWLVIEGRMERSQLGEPFPRFWTVPIKLPEIDFQCMVNNRIYCQIQLKITLIRTINPMLMSLQSVHRIYVLLLGFLLDTAFSDDPNMKLGHEFISLINIVP